MPTTEEVRTDLAETLQPIVGRCAWVDGCPARQVVHRRPRRGLVVDGRDHLRREEKFGVSIPDEEAKNLKTVGDAVAYIERAAS